MENDQTVFQNPNPKPALDNSQNTNPFAAPSINQSPFQPTPQSTPLTQPSPKVEETPIPPKSVVEGSGGRRFSAKMILRVLIGLIVLIVVAAVVYFMATTLFSNKNPEDGNAEIVFWGLWEDGKTMQVIIDDFQRLNPNIKVKYQKQDIKQYRETLTTRIDNGNGPDVYYFHNSWYPMFSSLLLPFPSDTISKDDFLNSFYPTTQKDLVKNGAIYGIPMGMDTLAMYVNKDIFAAAGLSYPKTWNDFIDSARTLTVKDEEGKIKTAGAAMGTFENVTHASDILSLLFLQNGVSFEDLEGSKDRFIGGLSFYSSFAKDTNNVWDSTLDPSLLAFSKGNLAIYFGYSWDFFTIKAFNPTLNFEITTVPQLPNQSINMASYWAAGVSSKSLYQKQALKFVAYLAKKEVEEKMYSEQSKQRAFGQPFARVDLLETVKDNPFVYPILLQAQTAESSAFVDSTSDNGLNQELNTYLGNAVNAIYNGSSTDSAFDTFSQGVLQVLQKYGQ